MAFAAILGYGTIGAGVARVLQTNAEVIQLRAGEPIRLKYILDLRDFPGDPNEDLVVHDYNIIMNDPDIGFIVECMGGTGAAYAFVKEALQKGISVATSNKELVASRGPELIEIARQQNANFMFEASVGGGIPVIRPLLTSLTGDVIENISGILNGTTNYMLTQMELQGVSFEDALKDAQDRGYAELHPEADVEGFDACRKIAILASLAFGKMVRFEDIYTEGIRNITAEDILYARALHAKIKLIASCWTDRGNVYALVSPVLVGESHPLAGVSDVFNAVFIHGNMVDDTMFYGRGAGSLPTASAVVGDVVDCVRRRGQHMDIVWEEEKLPLSDWGEYERSFFVRMPSDTADTLIEEAFGPVRPVRVEGLDEKAFITRTMQEKEFEKISSELKSVINRIRIDNSSLSKGGTEDADC